MGIIDQEGIKKGDLVKVKEGVFDPDFGDDLSGWQGKISEVDGAIVCIDLDYITLDQCSEKLIQRCEEDGLDWERIHLSIDDIEPAIPRITPANLRGIRDAIRLKHQWDHLGKSISKRIQEVLNETNITDENTVIDAWELYLSNQLFFPFDAEISAYQERGPLQQGDKVKVHGLVGSDDLYGVLVKLRLGRKEYHFPLCNIQVEDAKSNNYRMVDDYSVWFANR